MRRNGMHWIMVRHFVKPCRAMPHGNCAAPDASGRRDGDEGPDRRWTHPSHWTEKVPQGTWDFAFFLLCPAGSRQARPIHAQNALTPATCSKWTCVDWGDKFQRGPGVWSLCCSGTYTKYSKFDIATVTMTVRYNPILLNN